MSSAAIEKMRARARDVRTRALVRSWNYRQRNHAAGTWYRLRRALADARTAYVIGEEDAQRLIAEGYVPLACGAEIAPEKTILFVDDERLAEVDTRRQIPVSLGPDFLAARTIALVRFDDRSRT